MDTICRGCGSWCGVIWGHLFHVLPLSLLPISCPFTVPEIGKIQTKQNSHPICGNKILYFNIRFWVIYFLLLPALLILLTTPQTPEPTKTDWRAMKLLRELVNKIIETNFPHFEVRFCSCFYNSCGLLFGGISPFFSSTVSLLLRSTLQDINLLLRCSIVVLQSHCLQSLEATLFTYTWIWWMDHYQDSAGFDEMLRVWFRHLIQVEQGYL